MSTHEYKQYWNKSIEYIIFRQLYFHFLFQIIISKAISFLSIFAPPPPLSKSLKTPNRNIKLILADQSIF